jgi:hypothetical protein
MAGVGNPAARLIGRFPSMTPYSPGVPKRLPELPPSRVVSFRGPCGRTAFPVSPCQVLARKSLPGRGMSGSPRIYVGAIADTTGGYASSPPSSSTSIERCCSPEHEGAGLLYRQCCRRRSGVGTASGPACLRINRLKDRQATGTGGTRAPRRAPVDAQSHHSLC